MKYDGALKRRIPGKQFGLLAGDEDYASDAVRIADAQLAKLPALFEAHGVPFGEWHLLTLALAIAHVPGFKVSKPVGRNTKWSELDKAELRIDADATMATTRHKTVGEALRHLQKTSEKWKPFLNRLGSHVMKEYYNDADPRWVRMALDSRALHELEGRESER